MMSTNPTKTNIALPTRRGRWKTGIRGQRGVALILVLFTFGILAVLAGEFARAMREDAVSTVNYKLETVGHYAAIAAVNEAILAMVAARSDPNFDAQAPPDDETAGTGVQVIRDLMRGDGQWVRGRFAGVPYEVRAIDEGGKIAVNRVDGEVLHLLILNLGYEEEAAETVSDSILDWIDGDDDHRLHGAEDDYYGGLRRPYPAKNAPLEAVEELLLVRGVTREMFYGNQDVPGLRDIFSVFASSSKLNVRSVRPAVMIALAGVSKQEADGFKKRRRQNPAATQADLALLLGAASGATPRNALPNDVTIEARVKDSADRIVSQIGAVVKIRNGFRAYRWYDSMFHKDE